MQTHPFYKDILLHSDAELTELLSSRIIERETIHEWPLSCVQKLLLDDGTKLIYKSQLPPTVEAQFYENATTDLLPGHRLLGHLGHCQVMTIEWIDAPLLRDLARSATQLFDHGRNVLARIAAIEGQLPVHLDIGSAESWSNAVEETLEKLAGLLSDGRFRLITNGDAIRVREWGISSRIINAVTENPRLSHGDLKADQVFITPDGYRVIDWQRPVIAPPDVDMVSLFVESGIDPGEYVDDAVVEIFWFLRLYWAVEAQFDIFPNTTMPLLDRWAAEAIEQILK